MQFVTKNHDPPARNAWNQMSASCIFLDQAKFQSNQALNNGMGAPILCRVLGYAWPSLISLTVFGPRLLDSAISNLVSCLENSLKRYANHV